MADISKDASEDFIAKWQGVSASELSTSQSFLSDLCRLLGVETPHATPEQNYMFERPISFAHGDGSNSAGRIDLYRRGAFVLESKKLKAASHTKGFDDAMLRARSQAENYARALPAIEGRPPFVVVVDVGNRIELYSEFSRSGATYTPFPDPRSHRIALADLNKPEIRDRLYRIWTDPLSLDPSRESARVTREIAKQLAELAKSLEQSGHAPAAVAQFLMRCLFTMFAEDVKLLPSASFHDLLKKFADTPDVAMRMLAQLWRDMDSGGFSAVIAGYAPNFKTRKPNLRKIILKWPKSKTTKLFKPKRPQANTLAKRHLGSSPRRRRVTQPKHKPAFNRANQRMLHRTRHLENPLAATTRYARRIGPSL